MVAQTLRFLSDANRLLHLYEEGIEQAKEAVEIYKQLNDVWGQGISLQELSRLLHDDGQLDSAEEAALQAINFFSSEDSQFDVCRCYRILGLISSTKGETEKALSYFETALGMATASNWHEPLFLIHCSMADLFFYRHKFEDAHTHIEQAKSYAINDIYRLGHATEMQAIFWLNESKFEEVRGEALRAIDFYKKVGAMKDVEGCQAILQNIEVALSKPVGSH